MVEQVARLHSLSPDLDAHSPRFFKGKALGGGPGGDALLHWKLDFSLVQADLFGRVRERLASLAAPAFPLTYEVEVSGRVIFVKVFDKGNRPAEVCRAIQTFSTLSPAFVEGIIGEIGAFEKIPADARESICGELERVKQDLGPLLGRVKAIPPSAENVRLCHGDLHPGNFLVRGEDTVFLVDFDLAGVDFFYSDLAQLLENTRERAEFREAGEDGFELCLGRALEKYLAVRPLSVSAQELERRVRLFRPVLLLVWLKLLACFLEGGGKDAIDFYRTRVLAHYRSACEAALAL